MNTTAERVKARIAYMAGCKVDQVADQQNLANDLGLDSLDRYELTMEIEDEFNIDIPDEDAAPLNTVGEVIVLVESKVKS